MCRGFPVEVKPGFRSLVDQRPAGEATTFWMFRPAPTSPIKEVQEPEWKTNLQQDGGLYLEEAGMGVFGDFMQLAGIDHHLVGNRGVPKPWGEHSGSFGHLDRLVLYDLRIGVTGTGNTGIGKGALQYHAGDQFQPVFILGVFELSLPFATIQRAIGEGGLVIEDLFDSTGIKLGSGVERLLTEEEEYGYLEEAIPDLETESVDDDFWHWNENQQAFQHYDSELGLITCPESLD